MPLYSNILLSGRDDMEGNNHSPKAVTSQPSKTISSAAGMKLLQDHLLSKKRAKQTIHQVTKVQKTKDRSQPLSESSLSKNSDYDWDLNDEYDPTMPNSYEVLQLEHIKFEEQRQMQKKNTGKIDLSILDVLERFEDSDDPSPANRGTAIAPPPTLKASKSEIEPSSSPLPAKPNSMSNLTSCDKLDGSSAAAKIMAKMGYKAGLGLGKDQQGISTPLEFEQSGLSVGRIVQRAQTPPKSCQNEPQTTRVLLLQNMVGPGEVDDDLEMETKEECKKYGEIVKCLIYEIPNKRVPDDEAVRIFVEFRDEASSKRAVNDLNGRYFGGRVVRASFYDQDRFDKYVLAP